MMITKCMAVCALALLVFAGCGEEKTVDPYAEVSLRQAIYGPPVISKGYKYKIVNPEIVDAEGGLVFVRVGNVTGLIAGRSLAEKMEGLDRSNITFNVQKKYTPYVHFKCEQVVSGSDTVFIATAGGGILYPRIYEEADFRSKDHDDYDVDRLRWNDTSGLRRAKEKKLAVTCKIAKVEEDGDEVWMLQGKRTTLRVDSPDEGTAIILRLLAASDMDFSGGITFLEEEDWGARQKNQISGTVSIDWVKYAGKVFRG